MHYSVILFRPVKVDPGSVSMKVFTCRGYLRLGLFRPDHALGTSTRRSRHETAKAAMDPCIPLVALSSSRIRGESKACYLFPDVVYIESRAIHALAGASFEIIQGSVHLSLPATLNLSLTFPASVLFLKTQQYPGWRRYVYAIPCCCRYHFRGYCCPRGLRV